MKTSLNGSMTTGECEALDMRAHCAANPRRLCSAQCLASNAQRPAPSAFQRRSAVPTRTITARESIGRSDRPQNDHCRRLSSERSPPPGVTARSPYRQRARADYVPATPERLPRSGPPAHHSSTDRDNGAGPTKHPSPSESWATQYSASRRVRRGSRNADARRREARGAGDSTTRRLQRWR
jgi:hypothetical protein